MILLEIGGQSAELIETDGESVRFRASRAAPPGATLDATLDGVRYSIKVRGCRRSDDAFLIDGRWLNLSRQMRERLLGK